MAKTLRPPKAPNLPIGPVAYDQHYQNQLNNAQRLYYNQIDNSLFALLENDGGRYLNFPHIFASDSTKQYAGGNNTPTVVQWDTVARSEGFTLDTLTDSVIPTFSGAYRIDYRLMFENGDSAAHNVWVWLQKNGADVPNSCSKFSVPIGGYTNAVASIELDITSADTVQLYWATDKYSATAGGTGVWMDSYTASSSPFVRPAIPSAYGSITFVSELSQ